MIKNGTVITGDTGYFIGQTVEITDGIITFVGWPSDYQEPAGATVIDATGMTVMPGIIDSFIDGAGFDPSNTAGLATRNAFTMSGVTTACITGNSLETFASFEEGPFADGLAVGRVFSAGPQLARRNAWAPPTNETSPLYQVEWDSEIVDAITDVRERGAGYVSISIESVQGTSETAPPGPVFSADQIERIADIAHDNGLSSRISVFSYERLDDVLDSPVDVLDFTPAFPFLTGSVSPINRYPNVFIDANKLPPNEAQMVIWAAHKIAEMKNSYKILVPMITVMDEQYPWKRPAKPLEPRRSFYEEVVEYYVYLGGRVALGSGFQPGDGPGMPMHELLALQRAGMSPIQVITAATYHAAIACGAEDEIGTLEVGKKADVIIVNGPANDDLSALNKVTHVILDGELVKTP